MTDPTTAGVRGGILAALSRELRTRLSTVTGMTGLLLDTELNDEQRRYAEAIEASGIALLSSITDVVDFSLAESGRLELEHHPFDVRECVESALELVAARAAEKGLDLAYLVDPRVPAAVIGDLTRVRQVLVKLLTNAVTYTDQGEVVVTVAAEADPRDSGTTSGLPRLTFSIRDTGVGIPEARLRELLEPPPDQGRSTAGASVPSGLGLLVSTMLAKLMGGAISAESRVRQGSTFSFTVVLPPAPGSTPEVEESTASTWTRVRATSAPGTVEDLGAGRRLPLRILVAEDNAINQQLTVLRLEKLGYTADVAANGFEALQALERQQYDVVLMDVAMPEMDGLEATRRARRRWPGAERPRIVAMTASALPGDREACLAAGMDDYLSKPVQLTELARALSRCRPKSERAPTGVLDPPALGRIDRQESAGTGALAPPVFEPANIERLLATLDDDGPSVVADLIATFLEEAPALIDALLQALGRRQPEEVRTLAHALKSSTAQFGAAGLASLCREVEAATFDEDDDSSLRLVTLIEKEYRMASDALEAVRDSLVPRKRGAGPGR